MPSDSVIDPVLLGNNKGGQSLDSPGRNDMDDTQELNYTGICRAIAETDYDLYVGHEFKPLGDPIESLRQTFADCDQG